MSEQLYKAEDGCALRFFTRPEKNNFQSEKHGRMIFDTVLCVEVITPGSTESVPEFVCERTFCEETGLPPKRTEYYRRFSKQVEAFKSQNGAYAVDGTPLSAWPQIDAGTAQTLRASGVSTVEQLAEVSDGNLHNLGIGGRTLREKAKQWISSREFGIPTAQAGSRISELEAQVLALKAENETLRAMAGTAAPAPVQEAPEIGTLSAAEALGVPTPAPDAAADPFASLSGSQGLASADPPKAPALI